jgi:hypothetical protein
VLAGCGEMLLRTDTVQDGRFVMRGELTASADGSQGRFRGKFRQSGMALDMTNKAEEQGEPAADQLARLVGEGEAEVTVDTWIGPDDLPIRFRGHVRVTRPGGGRDQITVCEMTMDEYGVAVEASAPPLALVAPESVLN